MVAVRYEQMAMSSSDTVALPLRVVTDEQGLQTSEDALVERALAGDASAFGDLVARHERRVLATASRLLRDREDALDAAQETFVRLFKYLGTFDRGQDLGAWIHRIAVNVCRRVGAQRPRQVAGPAAEPGVPAATLVSSELDRALATLTETEREALVLRDIDGLSTEEVARVLGSSPVTVRVHICRARRKLREFLEGVR